MTCWSSDWVSVMMALEWKMIITKWNAMRVELRQWLCKVLATRIHMQSVFQLICGRGVDTFRTRARHSMLKLRTCRTPPHSFTKPVCCAVRQMLGTSCLRFTTTATHRFPLSALWTCVRCESVLRWITTENQGPRAHESSKNGKRQALTPKSNHATVRSCVCNPSLWLSSSSSPVRNEVSTTSTIDFYCAQYIYSVPLVRWGWPPPWGRRFMTPLRWKSRLIFNQTFAPDCTRLINRDNFKEHGKNVSACTQTCVSQAVSEMHNIQSNDCNLLSWLKNVDFSDLPFERRTTQLMATDEFASSHSVSSSAFPSFYEQIRVFNCSFVAWPVNSASWKQIKTTAHLQLRTLRWLRLICFWWMWSMIYTLPRTILRV